MLIIDIHSHLGNILHPGGGAVVLGSATMARPFDPDSLRRLSLYRFHGLDGTFYSIPAIGRLMTRAERKRNFTATYSNLASRMDRGGISYSIVLPIAPNTTFYDILPAAQADQRIIPFGSFDFSAHDLKDQAHRQLGLGARGFKLHPILQRVDPDGPDAHEALSTLPGGTVVLLHTGDANYYPRKESSLQRPEYANVDRIARLCGDFPALRFIAAHGGLRQFEQFIALLPGLPNVWADTTFLSPEGIRALIDAFGAERVLFGSDWPYGFHRTALDCVRTACRGRADELEAILGGNAKDMLAL